MGCDIYLYVEHYNKESKRWDNLSLYKKVTTAKGEAEANAILEKSLTDKVIQKQYVETLKSIGENGNLVVVPEGSSPIVSTGK